MGDKTGIEWTDATWNPVRGCSRVSTGCENCYAEQVAHRFSGPGLAYEGLASGGRWTGKVKLVREKLDQPLRWQRPRRIFVNSMSDLFHPEVPFEYVAAVFGVMAATSSRHTYQVLTKRADRMLEFYQWLDDQKDLGDYPTRALLCGSHAKRHISRPIEIPGIGWPLPNVWLGVTAENQATWSWRVEYLHQCPAAVRFVSVEPMVGPIDPCLFHWRKHIHWIICGGESGPGARPMHPEWARSLRDQCAEAGVPFLFKQWGEWAPVPAASRCRPGIESLRRVGKKAAGRELDGVVHDGYPEVRT